MNAAWKQSIPILMGAAQKGALAGAIKRFALFSAIILLSFFVMVDFSAAASAQKPAVHSPVVPAQTPAPLQSAPKFATPQAAANSSIKIITPKAGDSFLINSTKTIEWQYSNLSGTIKISLYKGGAPTSAFPLVSLTLDNSGRGTFNWSIQPNLTPPGNDYTIVIESNNKPGVKGVSSIFSITDKVMAKSMDKSAVSLMKDPSLINNSSFVATNPAAGSKWFRKGNYVITWNKNDWIKTNVSICLYQEGKFITSMAMSAPNSGNFSWKIPTTIPPGDYVIKINTIDNKFSADSYKFSIAMNLITKKVNVPIKSSHSTCVTNNQVTMNCNSSVKPYSLEDIFNGPIRVGIADRRWVFDKVVQCEYITTCLGWLLFDLPNLSTSDVKASFKYELLNVDAVDAVPTSVDGIAPPLCTENIYTATKKWSGPATPVALLTSNSPMWLDVSGKVRSWLLNPQSNFGFVFKPTEGTVGPNDRCIATYGNFSLEIEYMEEK